LAQKYEGPLFSKRCDSLSPSKQYEVFFKLNAKPSGKKLGVLIVVMKLRPLHNNVLMFSLHVGYNMQLFFSLVDCLKSRSGSTLNILALVFANYCPGARLVRA